MLKSQEFFRRKLSGIFQHEIPDTVLIVHILVHDSHGFLLMVKFYWTLVDVGDIAFKSKASIQ